MLGGAFFTNFDAFGELAISTFLVCTFGSPEHDGWNAQSFPRYAGYVLCNEISKLIFVNDKVKSPTCLLAPDCRST